MTQPQNLVLTDTTLRIEFIEALIADYKGLGITIRDREALGAVITEVHACFDQPDVDLGGFNKVMKAAAKALEKWQPVIEAARDAVNRLDGQEYGELAYKLGSAAVGAHADVDARVDAGVDALDSVIAAVTNLAQAVEAAAAPLGALVEHSAPARRKPGNTVNSPRIYTAVRVLCEFWERDQKRPASPEFKEGNPNSISSKFVHLTISRFIDAENKAAGRKVIEPQWKSKVSTEMDAWKKRDKR